MSLGMILLVVLALAAAGFLAGRARALKTTGGDPRDLHSLPGYHGQMVFLFSAVPALLLMGAWLLVQPVLIEQRAAALLTPADIPSGSSTSLVMSDVHRIADGLSTIGEMERLSEAEIAALGADIGGLQDRLGAVGVALGGEAKPAVFAAAMQYREDSRGARTAMTVAVILTALCGLGLSIRRIQPDLRARNVAETFVLALLIGSSLIAVLTTLGIIASLLFESLHFFRLYPIKDFLLSLTWNPQFRGGSDLGIWPLLWGTLYVSFIALLVATPIGLMIAIYLSEYASKRTRAIVKPAIEILAGIPTIVYGLFALVTVGPMLRDYLAQPLGLGSSSSSVMTAGLVMGIMVIPFVSSLSDDIINAVPQSLRDGSLGLGATPSETIKQVVLPAALPGVVGAILLAASRAIGETMIVVMGAGAAAKLSLNPFEAMTTVTVKIVSQLTGDTEFASPETLVAFALGLTLFTITLGLNILALYIVRKYREQYE